MERNESRKKPGLREAYVALCTACTGAALAAAESDFDRAQRALGVLNGSAAVIEPVSEVREPIEGEDGLRSGTFSESAAAQLLLIAQAKERNDAEGARMAYLLLDLIGSLAAAGLHSYAAGQFAGCATGGGRRKRLERTADGTRQSPKPVGKAA